jgi:hypothetical protein
VCVDSTGSGAAAVATGVGGGATVSTGGRASVSGAMLVIGFESAEEGAGAAATGASAFTDVRAHPATLKDSPLRKKAASNADSVFRLGIDLLIFNYQVSSNFQLLAAHFYLFSSAKG